MISHFVPTRCFHPTSHPHGELKDICTSVSWVCRSQDGELCLKRFRPAAPPTEEAHWSQEVRASPSGRFWGTIFWWGGVDYRGKGRQKDNKKKPWRVWVAWKTQKKRRCWQFCVLGWCRQSPGSLLLPTLTNISAWWTRSAAFTDVVCLCENLCGTFVSIWMF